MDLLKKYRIPIKGLKIGTHEYQFEVDSEFFRHFEESEETRGDFVILLRLDKQTDHYNLHYSVRGTLKTQCDRCLTDILLPINSEYSIILKFGDERNSDDEIEYIDFDEYEINVARHLFEFVRLSIPYVKVFDCDEAKDCDTQMLNYLEEERKDDNNPFRIAFKDLGT